MSRDDHQFRVRLPEDLRAEIIAQAEKNGRSINAEIVARLQNSLGWDQFDPAKMSKDIETLKARVESILDDLRFLHIQRIDEDMDRN